MKLMHKFKRDQVDKIIFNKKFNHDILFVQIYLDDIKSGAT